MKSRIRKRQIVERYLARIIRMTTEDRAWLDMAPVGREWGSPDWDRLERLEALANAAKAAADRTSAVIDETLEFIDKSNTRIKRMESRK